jgi:hypothetical protein
MLRPSDRSRLVLLALIVSALLATAVSALAARLIGGRPQAAVTGFLPPARARGKSDRLDPRLFELPGLVDRALGHSHAGG